ncbi:MAG: type VI secretion system tube protein Hcp [Planctomycetes bacterium]|nr:type VI secretion system tube protein Hcp [Planctomycetota bacterium]
MLAPLRFASLCFVLCAVCAASAAEQAKIFVQIEGVNGEHAEAGMEGAIRAEKLEYRLERSASKSFASKLGIEKRPNSLSFVKGLDRATPQLAKCVKDGRRVRTLTIKVFQAPQPGEALKHIFTLTLSNATVTSIDVFADETSGGRPLETVTVDYEEIDLKSETSGEQATIGK